MKKNLLLAFALLFSVMSVNAQRVLIDFDTESQTFVECFGNGGQAIDGCHTVVTNPGPGGVNTSDMVGTFIEPAEGETWMGVVFDVANGGDVDLSVATGNTNLCADVWVPTLAPFTFKVENTSGTPDPYEGGRIMPSAAGEWVTVCDDMATFDGAANRLVFFFNIDEIPGAETTYYFDNVSQPGPTSVGGLIEEKGLTIYPNPATYNLFFNADGEPMTVIVSDFMGREMSRLNSFSGNNISVADLNPGMYVVTFIEESTGRFGSTKFSKQ
ncbi:MAG: hypothetical protein ACI9RM_001399 [Ulvibacter sp.]|jgi:hypothetical protein